MSELVIACILGIVEGFTEFLPISSTGHLILVNNFVDFTGSFANMFNIVIQLGAILSVTVYFRERLFPFRKADGLWERQKALDLWKKTMVGVSPALVFGALLGNYIEELLFNPTTVATALVVGGILLIVIERKPRLSSINSIQNLSYRLAFSIGLIQCLAMIPGTSRSAATIIGAMLLGTSRVVAAEFSFFLAIPTMVAASGYSLLKMGTDISLSQIQVLAVGFVVSFIVALLVIAAFMSYISRKTFTPFGYYRIALGLIVLAYFNFFN